MSEVPGNDRLRIVMSGTELEEIIEKNRVFGRKELVDEIIAAYGDANEMIAPLTFTALRTLAERRI